MVYKYLKKKEQNLGGKGVNIQKYWMICQGITLGPVDPER